LTHLDSQSHVHVMLNAYWEPLLFELPDLSAKERWQRLVDTARASPEDLSNPPVALPSDQRQYQVQARSSVILVAGSTD
jgi:isoamylase